MSKEDKSADEPKRNIGIVVCEALRERKTNDEALAAAKAEFPDGNTSLASVNWYRNKLRQDGEDVPTSRELKKERAEAEADKASEGGKGKGKGKKAAATKESDPLE